MAQKKYKNQLIQTDNPQTNSITIQTNMINIHRPILDNLIAMQSIINFNNFERIIDFKPNPKKTFHALTRFIEHGGKIYDRSDITALKMEIFRALIHGIINSNSSSKRRPHRTPGTVRVQYHDWEYIIKPDKKNKKIWVHTMYPLGMHQIVRINEKQYEKKEKGNIL